MNNNKPKMIREDIERLEFVDQELDGKTIKDVIQYFNQWPQDAKFDIESVTEYGCGYTHGSVYRMRPETLEEQEKRIASTEFSENYQEERRRKQYEELKKEFGG